MDTRCENGPQELQFGHKNPKTYARFRNLAADCRFGQKHYKSYARIQFLTPNLRIGQQDFEALFAKYRQLVYRAAYSVTGKRQDAEDALQSLFVRLIDQGFSEDSVRDPAGYLYRAAVNEARQMYRAQERRNHTDDDVELLKDPQGDRSAGEDGMRERLLDAMAKLEPEYAEVLICYGNGYSDAEIAASLGKTRGAVAMTLHRSERTAERIDV